MLHIEKALRFVHGDDAAAELDADSDDDVLALVAQPGPAGADRG